MAGNRHFGPEMDKVSGKVSYGACRRPGLFLYRRSLSALRLSVRTPPFHGGERGSIPLGRARLSSLTFRLAGSRSPVCALLHGAHAQAGKSAGWQERGGRAGTVSVLSARPLVCLLVCHFRFCDMAARFGVPLEWAAGNTDAPGRGRGASGRAGRFWAALRLWGMGNQRRSCFRRATSG